MVDRAVGTGTTERRERLRWCSGTTRQGSVAVDGKAVGMRIPGQNDARHGEAGRVRCGGERRRASAGFLGFHGWRLRRGIGRCTSPRVPSQIKTPFIEFQVFFGLHIHEVSRMKLHRIVSHAPPHEILPPNLICCANTHYYLTNQASKQASN